jgi:hypothetical protein
MPHEPEPAQETREIYADFIFSERQQALDFAELVGDGTVSVAFAAERKRWRATVRRRIQPVFRDITVWLSTLTARAATVGGDYDDWGKVRQPMMPNTALEPTATAPSVFGLSYEI